MIEAADLAFELGEGYTITRDDVDDDVFRAHRIYCDVRAKHLEMVEKQQRMAADNAQRGQKARSQQKGI